MNKPLLLPLESLLWRNEAA